MKDTLREIAETADELTDPIRHVERIHDRDGHRNRRLRRVWMVTLPPLLQQLASAVVPGEAYIEESGGTAVGQDFGSRPPGRLDAVDRLLAIEVAAARWCSSVGLPLRDDPAGNIRALVGAAATMDSDRQRDLLGDLQAWRTWAATVAGWERPPDAPRAPCPHCEARGTLRVRLDRQTGCCVGCGAAWDAYTVGLLAEHVRAYQARSSAASKAAWLAVLLRERLGEHVVEVRVDRAAPIRALFTLVLINGLPSWRVDLVVSAEDRPRYLARVGEFVAVEIAGVLRSPLIGRAICTSMGGVVGEETHVTLVGATLLERVATAVVDEMPLSDARSS